MTTKRRTQAPSAASRELSTEVEGLLTSIKPHALCDSCIALDAHVSHAEAHEAAVSAATGEAFQRTLGRCHRCGRAVETTGAH
jgi:flagellar biosynthesis regulator FlbT